MDKVFKYKLGKIGENKNTILYLPRRAQILSLYTQRSGPDETLYLWARVNPENPDEIRTFRAFMTGEDLKVGRDDKFIGTVHMADGCFVLHVFEIISN